MKQSISKNECHESDWRLNWQKKCIGGGVSRVLVESNYCYSDWLENIPNSWNELVYMPHLQEISKHIKIEKHTEHYSDCKFGKYHLFFVEEEISKLRILEKEAIFNKLIWIVDFRQIYLNSQHELAPGTLMHDTPYVDFDLYVNHLKKRLLQIVKIKNDYICDVHDLYKSNKIKILESLRLLNIEYNEIEYFLLDVKLNSTIYKKYCEEEWHKCIRFPN
ncbi:hypothetical protein, partial [Hymenobacter terrestris]